MKDDRSITINITSATIIKTVVILVFFWFLYFMRDLVVVILTALVLASAIEPLVLWLGKYKLPRTIAVILIYLVIAVLLSGVFYFFVPSLLNDLSDMLSKLPTYFDTLTVWNPFGTGVLPPSEVVENFGIKGGVSFSDLIGQFNDAFISSSQGLLQAISSLFGGILSLVLIVVLSFYLAVQEDGVGKFLNIVVPDRYEQVVMTLWRRSQIKIGRWLQGQFLLAILIGVLVYLGLTILGVRNALLLALLAAAFEIIPVFGPILSAIPSTLIALTDGGLTKGLLVIGLYVIINQFENHLIYPLVVKKIVGIPPILVILAIIVGFKLSGVLGIILAVPVAAILVEFLDYIQKSKLANKAASQA